MNPIIRHMLAVDAEREQADALRSFSGCVSGGLPYTAEQLQCLEDGVVTEEELAEGWPFAPMKEPVQFREYSFDLDGMNRNGCRLQAPGYNPRTIMLDRCPFPPDIEDLMGIRSVWKCAYRSWRGDQREKMLPDNMTPMIFMPTPRGPRMSGIIDGSP